MSPLRAARCHANDKGTRNGLGAARKTRWSYVPLGSRLSVYESSVPPTVVALSDDTEHESAWKLLG